VKNNGYEASIQSFVVDLYLGFLLSVVILKHQYRRLGLPTLDLQQLR